MLSIKSSTSCLSSSLKYSATVSPVKPTLALAPGGSFICPYTSVVLLSTDSPVSSLEDVLDYAADYRTLPIGGLAIPESLEDAAMMMVSFRYGVDFSAVNYTDIDDLVTVPLLTFQGTDDETVPRAVNDRFMRLAGEGGTYVLVDGADHVLAWNVDPEGYHDQIEDFVKELEKG